MGIVQGAKESLREYLNRFTKEALKVPDLDDKVAMIALQQGTRDEFFKMSLAKRPPESMLQLQDRAGKYIKGEESMKKITVNNEPTGNKKRRTDQEYDSKDKQLKDEIEYLIRRGKFGRFTKGEKVGGQKRDNDRRDDDRRGNDIDRNLQPRGPVINIISGGPTAAGTTRNSRKAYAREVMSIAGEPSKNSKSEMMLEFGDLDLEGLIYTQDDPLVITPIIGNCLLMRVLVDNGAFVDIFFHNTFIKMGHNNFQLTPSDAPIYGFNHVECKVEGAIQLPVTIGEEPIEATQMLNFQVVKVASTYNAIMGRTGIHALKDVPSTYHMVLSFPTRNGVREARRDHKMARSCYVAALRPDGTGGQVLPIKDMDVRENDELQGKPAEDLVSIPLDPLDPEKVTYIGAYLDKPLKG
ncbi:uncharacterized protein LOC141690399 [Apium graveolens]|uniref:uncharacterized protein LOC141690399 n=1 Tax=Apium graveolens TaxID=4045 RepID=UPI003D7B8A39